MLLRMIESMVVAVVLSTALAPTPITIQGNSSFVVHNKSIGNVPNQTNSSAYTESAVGFFTVGSSVGNVPLV